jgi:phage baseplate assembly protein W
MDVLEHLINTIQISDHIYEILSSNLGMRAGFPDWGSNMVLSIPSKEMVAQTPN